MDDIFSVFISIVAGAGGGALYTMAMSYWNRPEAAPKAEERESGVARYQSYKALK